MASDNIVYVSIELSVSSWLVAARLPNTEKLRLHRLEGDDTVGLLTVLAELRSRASLKRGSSAKVACCFEAGRDGFWLHRLLTANGVAASCKDEAGVGQQGPLSYVWASVGSRPPMVRDNRNDNAYIFGAICPARGVGAAVITPAANTECMNLHLEEISTQVAPGSIAAVICDGAGWH